MTKTQFLQRKKALQWWSNITITNKIDAVLFWQNKIPKGTLGKEWPFTLVAASDSTIEKIYLFIKPITHDKEFSYYTS